jgi:hypothetical protein
VERVTLGYGLFNDTTLVSRILLLLVNVVPFWLSLASLRRSLHLLEASGPATLYVLAAAGFGTLLNPYLTTLNNHTPAAAAAMLAIEAAIRMRRPGKTGRLTRAGSAANARTNGEFEINDMPSPSPDRPASAPAGAACGLSAEEQGPSHFRVTIPADSPEASAGPARVSAGSFVALGFCSALTACFELPAALLGLLALVCAAATSFRLTVRAFIPAALIPLLAFFATNWMATGGIKPFYAGYGSPTYVYVHNGVPSYWSNPRDLDANREGLPAYLFHCVLGHHGLVSLMPALLVSLAGACHCWRRDDSPILRGTILCGTLLTLVTLVFYLSRTENYNYGGNSFALRWMEIRRRHGPAARVHRNSSMVSATAVETILAL